MQFTLVLNAKGTGDQRRETEREEQEEGKDKPEAAQSDGKCSDIKSTEKDAKAEQDSADKPLAKGDNNDGKVLAGGERDEEGGVTVT
jgi:hypothetical protein